MTRTSRDTSAVGMNCKHALINYLRKLIKMLSKDELPPEIWHYILLNFNNSELKEIATVSKLFNEIFHCSRKIRPTFPDYRNPIQPLKEDIDWPYLCYPLDDGYIAFALINPSEGQKSHSTLLIYCTGKDTPIYFNGHKNRITDVILINDHTIASTSHDGTIRIWEIRTGKEQRLIKDKKIIKPLKLIPLNDDKIACFSQNGQAHIWNWRSGMYLGQLLCFPKQRFVRCRVKEEIVFIEHSQEDAYLNTHNIFTVWDLKEN